ncbi:thiol peroxidase [Putridiphycobacter roseus]|uniref:Thiol peroxidase n=1 Tax=Putridiphycobacter roseus TaxID=2219161 RepID=A0A2W1MWQ1_9FLAO|nr:thiol peroxidase [Putridiphycobacter roseus]PZE16549.1 thiol peroxidase [Putridiphycobacter roseus]
MGTVTLKGNAIKTIGELPEVGTKAPDFTLVKTDLSQISLADFKGNKLVLNIFPSVDTGTCAQSVRRFNQEASKLEHTKVLCISSDLPFAQNRFCGAEGLEDVVMLSDYATSKFGKDYGLEMISGPLFNLHSRVVIVVDSEGVITYTEQVPEIVDEPNYDKALQALQDSK